MWRNDAYSQCLLTLCNTYEFLLCFLVLEVWPWPQGSLRIPHEGIGLGTSDFGLGLGLGLERKILAFPEDPSHEVAVGVCSAHSHGVT